MEDKSQDILKIPLRIICIFIILSFVGVYWVQSKFCPCEPDRIQMIAQYNTFGAFGEFISVIVVIAGAAVFVCLGYRLMETVLHLSLSSWGKNKEHRNRVMKRSNLAALIVILFLLTVTAGTIVGYIWIDANTYAVLTDTGYEEYGIFSNIQYDWDDMVSCEYDKGEDGGITEVLCTFEDGQTLEIRLTNFTHTTRAFDEKYGEVEI